MNYVVPAVVVAFIIVYWLFAMRKANALRAQYAKAGPGMVKTEDPQQIQDRLDPARAFGQACFFISMGGEDYGYYEASAPQKMLDASWGIVDRAGAEARIRELLDDPHAGDDGELVFDRVRAMFIARSCAGAGFISQDESWRYVAKAGRDLQSRLTGFEHVGSLYVAKAKAWCAANGVADTQTDKNVEQLRQTIWRHHRFDAPLPG